MISSASSTTPRSARSSVSVGNIASATVYSRKLEELKAEVKTLEEASKRKESALIQQDAELQRLRDDASQLRVEMDRKNNEIKRLSAENKALSEIGQHQQYTIHMLEKDIAEMRTNSNSSANISFTGDNNKASGSGGSINSSSNSGANSSLTLGGRSAQKSSNPLKEQVAARDREIEKLKSANQFLLATIDRYDKALMNLNEIAKLSFGGEGDVSREELQARVKVLLASLVELKGSSANANISTGTNANANANASGSNGSFSAYSPITNNSVDMADPVAARTWMEEKRVLLADIRRLNESVGIQEMTIRAQHTRILQLTDRIDFIGEELRDFKTRSHSGSAVFAAANSAEFELANGSMTHFRRPVSLNPADLQVDIFVPTSIVEFLEKDVQTLKEELKVKQLALIERGEVLEMLERKVEVIQHARETEGRNAARRVRTLQTQLDEFRIQTHSAHIASKQEVFSLPIRTKKVAADVAIAAANRSRSKRST